MTKLGELLDEAMGVRFGEDPKLPVAVSVSPETIRAHLRTRYDFAAPMPLQALFRDVDGMLRRWTEHASNPMHFGLFRPNVDEASVVGDALAALYDPNLATWDFAPAANEIERHTLSAIAARFGYDPAAAICHFTSGGQEANHTALLSALAAAFPEIEKRGLRTLKGQPVFYLSVEGHHSLEKAAAHSGIGHESLRWIPVQQDLRMDVDALEDQIRADRAAGCEPFMIVATAGTTNAGVIDPLGRIADVARRESLWYHVDAAWGGAAALSDELRPLLDGIERADSITCDAHKWISTPVGAGMFFCRHPAAVESAFATDTPYVPEQSAGRAYFYATTMQWSRRFIGLKVFLMFAARGMPAIARRIEHQARMGRYLRRLLHRHGWELLNDSPLPVVCFHHAELSSIDRSEAIISRVLREKQDAWISATVLRGRVPALRACVTNFATEREHVERLVTLLERERAALRSVDLP